MGSNHSANISVKFRVQLLNVYCLFCLTGNLRLFLIYYFELVSIGEWMAFGRTMITKRPGGLPDVGRFNGVLAFETKLDPELNRNVGKMVTPHVFDSILGIKPKNPCVASLLSQESGSQDSR